MGKPDILFAIGALCIAAGVALIYVPAGIIVFGVLAIVGAVVLALAERGAAVRQLERQRELEPVADAEVAA